MDPSSYKYGRVGSKRSSSRPTKIGEENMNGVPSKRFIHKLFSPANYELKNKQFFPEPSEMTKITLPTAQLSPPQNEVFNTAMKIEDAYHKRLTPFLHSSATNRITKKSHSNDDENFPKKMQRKIPSLIFKANSKNNNPLTEYIMPNNHQQLETPPNPSKRHLFGLLPHEFKQNNAKIASERKDVYPTFEAISELFPSSYMYHNGETGLRGCNSSMEIGTFGITFKATITILFCHLV